MPDARSPIRHHLVLYRRDPEQGRARFVSLMIERDLFGTIRLDDRHTRAWRGPVRLLSARTQGSRYGRPVLSFGRIEFQKQMGCQ
jgi:hypothetical protein